MTDILDVDDRFWSKVSPEPNSGCWIWTAGVTKAGYGIFSVGGRRGKKVYAHAHAYRLVHGPEPNDGLVHDHKCRVRCCVNPSHIRRVTHQVNILVGVGAAAVNAVKTHCIRGHAFDAKNTIFALGGRRCRTCVNDAKRAAHHSAKRRAITCQAPS